MFLSHIFFIKVNLEIIYVKGSAMGKLSFLFLFKNDGHVQVSIVLLNPSIPLLQQVAVKVLTPASDLSFTDKVEVFSNLNSERVEGR